MLTGVLLVLPAKAGDDEVAQQLGKLWQSSLLAPLPRQSGEEQLKAIAFPDKHRQRLLDNVAAISLDQLDYPLSQLLPALRWGYGTMANPYDGDLDLLGIRITNYAVASERSVPEWLTEALVRRVQQLGLQGGAAKRPVRPLRWQYSPWYEPEKSAYTELEFAAMAWAGPAVRDHAQYVENDGHTRIRVSRTQENSLKVLVAWAYQRGLPLKLSLDASKPLDSVKPLPILAKTNIPVWLVTPQGLVAARLTSLHTGDPCLGGGWLELEAGAGLRPAIWAILFLPEEVRASAAIIERLKPEPDSDPYLLAMHSKLTVSWPDMRLPMLTVSAKKFQWRKYPQREKRNTANPWDRLGHHYRNRRAGAGATRPHQRGRYARMPASVNNPASSKVSDKYSSTSSSTCAVTVSKVKSMATAAKPTSTAATPHRRACASMCSLSQPSRASPARPYTLITDCAQRNPPSISLTKRSTTIPEGAS